MEIRLLGPVEASVDGRPVPLGAGKPRALFALLALRAGSTVSSDRLIDGLWGERPPATAIKLVHLHVSTLRKSLAAAGDGAQILTRGHGYELRLGPDDVDARRFERLVAGGRAREALALWRGPALDDVSAEPFAGPEIRRLEELRLAAVELAIEHDLEAGRHREVVGELEGLVLEEPLRERLHAQRMLALYRSGRQADALGAYRQARAALVEEIGVEPGPELRELHEAILRHDPSLHPPAPERLEPELAIGPPLFGRETELERLRGHWRAAQHREGRLVLVAGPPGIGKTRLAAELAAEVRRDLGSVVYASAADGLDGALASAGAPGRPTLLVVDDAGATSPDVLGELVDPLAAQPLLLVVIAEDEAPVEGLPVSEVLTLGPLGADAVAAVARTYTGPGEHVEVPVARLLLESGGPPQRLHRAASEWARTYAVSQVRDSASRVTAERGALRTAEDDLTGNVVALQAAHERAELGHMADERVVLCPFKGLAAFEVEDAEYFFGRERLVAELVARLVGAPLTAIVGASGSGKSSLLRAGLLAALAAGVLPGSESWALALLRPGEHPLRALEEAVGHAPPRGRLVIAVDQFEECFTSCRDESERAAFIEALVASARDPRRRALVLIAVRADYYGRCAAYPELSRLLGASNVLVGPLRRDELRRAIELPAGRAGLEVEPELGRAARRLRGRARSAATAVHVAARALAAPRAAPPDPGRLRARRRPSRRGGAAGRAGLRATPTRPARSGAANPATAGGRGRGRRGGAPAGAAGRTGGRARRRGFGARGARRRSTGDHRRG